MKQEDSNIIFYAFRYALGRKTGAVGEVVMYILNHWKDIPKKDKLQMKQEILNFSPVYGELTQMDEWSKILDRKI